MTWRTAAKKNKERNGRETIERVLPDITVGLFSVPSVASMVKSLLFLLSSLKRKEEFLREKRDTVFCLRVFCDKTAIEMK